MDQQQPITQIEIPQPPKKSFWDKSINYVYVSIVTTVIIGVLFFFIVLRAQKANLTPVSQQTVDTHQASKVAVCNPAGPFENKIDPGSLSTGSPLPTITGTYTDDDSGLEAVILKGTNPNPKFSISGPDVVYYAFTYHGGVLSRNSDCHTFSFSAWPELSAGTYTVGIFTFKELREKDGSYGGNDTPAVLVAQGTLIVDPSKVSSGSIAQNYLEKGCCEEYFLLKPKDTMQHLQSLGVISKTEAQPDVDGVPYFAATTSFNFFGMQVSGLGFYDADDTNTFLGNSTGTRPPTMISIVVPYDVNTVKSKLTKVYIDNATIVAYDTDNNAKLPTYNSENMTEITFYPDSQ